MKPPLLSVVLPSYNHSRYIRETLDSIRAQDYPNLELLIIDDGSTDGSAKIIQDWIEKDSEGLKVSFRSRPNKGISATLNELLDMSSGDYVAGASSDDSFLPSSFSDRMNYLEDHLEKMAVFGNFHVIDASSDLITANGIEDYFGGVKSDFSDDISLQESLLRGFCIAGPVILFRKSVFEKIGNYDEGLQIEDWDIYLRLSSSQLLGYIDKPVAAYRVHDANSHKNRKKTLESVRYQRRVLEKNKHLYEGDDLLYISKLIKRRKKKEISYVIEGFFKKLLELVGLRKRK